MMDELPKIFAQCMPRPAPAELRAQTLAAVERELAQRRKPRWERALELAVAASLLLGVGLNVWLWQSDAARQINLAQHGPSTAAREVAQAVASAAGLDAGRWVQNAFARAESRKRGRGATGNERFQRLLHELTLGRPAESL